MNFKLAKTLSLIVLIVTFSSPLFAEQSEFQKKFSTVYRAGKSIEGASIIGVNYEKFETLLHNLATEIAILRDQVKSKKELETYESYAEALEHYRDGLIILRGKLIYQHPNGEIEVTPEMDEIIQKYYFDTQEHTTKLNPITRRYYMEEWVSISEDSLYVIWKKAARSLERANDLYYSK